jgi:Txe/YoeB family toxin of Txe-Axe toxin-antitoxin module
MSVMDNLSGRMMIKSWHDEARDDYLHRQIQDKKTFKRINLLLKDERENGNRF